MKGKLFIYRQKLKLAMKYISYSTGKFWVPLRSNKRAGSSVVIKDQSQYIQTPLQ